MVQYLRSGSSRKISSSSSCLSYRESHQHYDEDHKGTVLSIMDYGSFPPYAEYPDPPDELPNIMDYASSPEEHPTIMEHPVPSEQLPLTAEDANPPEEHSASTTNNWELDASELPPLPPSPVVPGGAPLDTPEQTADEYQPAEVPLPHDGTDLTAFWELGGTVSRALS